MKKIPAVIKRAEAIAQAQPQDIVAVYAVDERCAWASPSHYDILGYTPEEMTGYTWRDMVAPEDHAHADLAGSDALLNGRSIEFGFRAVTKQGDRLPMRGAAWITVDQDSGTPYLVFQGTPQKK